TSRRCSGTTNERPDFRPISRLSQDAPSLLRGGARREIHSHPPLFPSHAVCFELGSRCGLLSQTHTRILGDGQKHEQNLMSHSLDFHTEDRIRMNGMFLRLSFMTRNVLSKGLVGLAVFVAGTFGLASGAEGG